MKLYQAVFPEKNFLGNTHKKEGLGVLTLSYLPFLVRAMTKNIIIQNLDYIRLSRLS